MRARPRIILTLLLVALLLPPAALAADVEVGQRIELKADKPAGVPLHREPRPSIFGRAADHSVAAVIGLGGGGRWLNIDLDDGRTAWIIGRYVGRVLPGDGRPPDGDHTAEDEFTVWTSLEGCEQVVGAGRRMVEGGTDTLRLATWNVRWFPDGDLNPNADKDTDLAWLACAMAWMNLDLVAMQEIRTTAKARDAWDAVLDGLHASTGDEWRVELQACGAPDRQHVGFLWNTARVRLSDGEDLWRLNGAAAGPGEPCAAALRPGRYAHVEAVGGGLDFHAITVHLDSGTTLRDLGNRRTALGRIDEAVEGLLGRDGDVVILGDMNTMGLGDAQSEAEEQEELARTAAAEAPGFERLPVRPECTHYFDGQGGWLDHVLVAEATGEAAVREARVTGHCALLACAPFDDREPAAYERLSDHCPVVVELENRDVD